MGVTPTPGCGTTDGLASSVSLIPVHGFTQPLSLRHMLTRIICLHRILGRRALQSYLLMFIHSSPALQPDHDYEKILERALNSYTLGEHVAPHWALGKVLKWRPMNVGNMSKPLGPDVDVPSPLLNVKGSNARSIGMYKVYGTTVEAVVGGVFHQFVSARIMCWGLRGFRSWRISCRVYRVELLPIGYSTPVSYPIFASQVASTVCTRDTTSTHWRSASVWAALKGLFSGDECTPVLGLIVSLLAHEVIDALLSSLCA